MSFQLISKIIALYLLNATVCNKLIIPFRTNTSNNIQDSISTDYINNLINNKIYITLEIGTPPQSINIYLTTQTRFFLISSNIISENYYNLEKSKTYYNITSKQSFYLDLFSEAIISNETINFQTSFNNEFQSFNNIEFFLVTEYSSKTELYSGYLGLQLINNYNINKYNFLQNLKNINAISSYIWNINYKNDNEGYLIIGEYPHEYDSKNNNEKNIKHTSAISCNNNNDLCWFLKFTDIKFADINMSRQRTAEIRPELGLIIGTLEYMEKLDNNFFNLLGEKCEKKNNGDYYFYVCDKNIFNEVKFDDLIFKHQEFLYEFVLNKNDLFKEYNDKLYFMVIFSTISSYQTNWQLGKIFLKKYNFAFDSDKKEIYFYDNDVKNDSNNNSKKDYIAWIIIGILVICIIAAGILIYKKVECKKKKMKAEELDEDYANINIMNDNKN